MAGINLDHGKVTIAPHPDKRLGYVRASYESPFGEIGVSWKAEGSSFDYEIDLPSNVTATVILPGKEPFEASAGKYKYSV